MENMNNFGERELNWKIRPSDLVLKVQLRDGIKHHSKLGIDSSIWSMSCNGQVVSGPAFSILTYGGSSGELWRMTGTDLVRNKAINASLLSSKSTHSLLMVWCQRAEWHNGWGLTEIYFMRSSSYALLIPPFRPFVTLIELNLQVFTIQPMKEKRILNLLMKWWNVETIWTIIQKKWEAVDSELIKLLLSPIRPLLP